MATSKEKTTALAVAPTDEQLALLRGEFPAEQGFTRVQLPRLGMYSQDQIEETKNKKTGKKEINVITEAGTFFTEDETDEKDENDKKIWEKSELGTEIEAIIVFQRKQLKYYNTSTEEFTSSPVYDSDDEIVPLFLNKAEIDRGTPKELKAREMYQYTKEGKTRSSLEETRVLYVVYEGKVRQLNLRGSSMYAFMKYAKECIVPGVLTKLSSTPMEKGEIKWNQMTFEVVRPLNKTEVDEVLANIAEIKDGIAQEKAFFANAAGNTAAQDKANKDFDDM